MKYSRCHNTDVANLPLPYTIRIRYDTIEEFTVDSKAKCDQLNVAHTAEK